MLKQTERETDTSSERPAMYTQREKDTNTSSQRPAMLVDLKDFSAAQSAVDDVTPRNAPTITMSHTHTCDTIARTQT